MDEKLIEQDNADYKGEFYLLGEQEGGQDGALKNGIRPQHQINGNCHTSGLMRFIDKDIIWPGEKVLVYTTLISPEAYEGSLKVGNIINIYAGANKIGEVTLIEIYNPSLGKTC